MCAAVKLREDFWSQELRALARRAKDVNQRRRLLSLAAGRHGKDRVEAARIGGMDRQTLREWVHRFNASGVDGLFDPWTFFVLPLVLLIVTVIASYFPARRAAAIDPNQALREE